MPPSWRIQAAVYETARRSSTLRGGSVGRVVLVPTEAHNLGFAGATRPLQPQHASEAREPHKLADPVRLRVLRRRAGLAL